VAFLVLKEITTDLADPTTYRELTLLNSMVEKNEGDDPLLRAQQEEEAEAAAQRLRNVGVTPETAMGMIRVFQSLEQVMNGTERKQLAAGAAEVPKKRRPVRAE